MSRLPGLDSPSPSFDAFVWRGIFAPEAPTSFDEPLSFDGPISLDGPGCLGFFPFLIEVWLDGSSVAYVDELMAIVVDQPIIDSPFDQPTRHHRVLEGAPDVIETRRPSGYMPPGDDPGPD